MSERSGVRAGSTGELPAIRLEIVDDLSPETGPGYLRLVRRKLRAHYPDGSSSEPFVYDEVERQAIDATVIVAHYLRRSRPGEEPERRVFLRSAIRPPPYFRGAARAPVAVPVRGGLWELPAGLVEVGEQSPAGLLRSAARELHEETGFEVAPSELAPLGPSVYPCPGVLSERHFFFEVEISPEARRAPLEDGSALERSAKLIDVPLSEALSWCRVGEIEDSKTELGLRRLAERFP